MNRNRKYAKTYIAYVADFETTVYENQEITEVWASAIVPVGGTEKDVVVENSIDKFFEYIENASTNMKIYFHNLKFDGAFILDYLKRNDTWTEWSDGDIWKDRFEMEDHTYTYLISDMGQWYNIILKIGKREIIIADSLKLLPFSVKVIGDGFGTEHRKTSIEYTGYRNAGGAITEEEKKYIKNDVLVVAEALEIFIKEGHQKSTIGGNCLSEYRKIFESEKLKWKKYFPDLKDTAIDPDIYGSDNAEAYIRKSYRGGWCYLKKGKEDKVYHNGITLDVNSLYPSMMHGDSGNLYPVGQPTFWTGNTIPEEALKPLKYYFVRIKTKFHIKKNFLPFIQVKNSIYFSGTEMLESSIGQGLHTGEKHDDYITMTMTMTDWELFNKHYDHETIILDGCYFDSISGIFDFYINKYAKIKKENKGAKRMLAKLFLNNLYGQFAKSDDSSYKMARLDGETNRIKFRSVERHDKPVVYIPIGSAITSYARAFTITAAQANYEHFVYSDTDSIHLENMKKEEAVGVKLHTKDFQCWDCEMEWDTAFFHRQKTYIEIEGNEYTIKGAGMPEACKEVFRNGIENGKYKLTDYTKGLELPGKLLPKRIPGGIILTDTTFLMRD